MHMVTELSQSDRISVAVSCAGASQKLRGSVSEASQGNRRSRSGAEARAVVEASASDCGAVAEARADRRRTVEARFGEWRRQ